MKYDKDIRVCRWAITAIAFGLMFTALWEARTGQWWNLIATGLWISVCAMLRSSMRSQQKTRDEMRITGALMMEQLRKEQERL